VILSIQKIIMPRKRIFRPNKNTIKERYSNNPYFYRNSSQYENLLKLRAFIRDLKIDNERLRKENTKLNRLCEEKIEEIEDIKGINIMLTEEKIDLEKEIARLVEVSNKLTDENVQLRLKNVKLSEVNRIYQLEISNKIVNNEVNQQDDLSLLNFR
jgi:hypothetical protein